MHENENIRNLEKAITQFLTSQGLREFRWIYEEERSTNDLFATRLVIDGDVLLYFWELSGIDELNWVSEQYGYFIEPINHIDIGFFNIAEFQEL